MPLATHTPADRDAPPQSPSPPPTGRRLIETRAAAAKAGVSARHWLRLCDYGLAPFGVKLLSLRRWDESVIEEWIAGGCQPVRPQAQADGSEVGNARH